MTEEKKKGSWLTNNPIVRAIGVQRLVVVIVLIVLVVFFWISSPAFGKYSTLLSLLDYTYYLAFLAMGVTFCLLTGGVDLSIGTGMFCYAIIGGYLITHMNAPVIVGILVTLLCGLAMGTANGLIVTRGGHAPFLATLCTMMIARGLGAILTNSTSVTWPASNVANGWTRLIFKIDINGTKYPLGLLWVLLLMVFFSFFLNRTKPGRYIIAIGSNEEAARLSGVNTKNYKLLAYMICGLCTGLAALAYASAFQSIAPGGGGGIELNAVGAAIIGGTSMSGGTGSVIGTILGVFIMSVLQTGLPYIGLQANYQQIIIGLVLIVAVYIDVMRNRRMARQ